MVTRVDAVPCSGLASTSDSCVTYPGRAPRAADCPSMAADSPGFRPKCKRIPPFARWGTSTPRARAPAEQLSDRGRELVDRERLREEPVGLAQAPLAAVAAARIAR